MRTSMVGLEIGQLLRNLEFVDHYDPRTASREVMYWLVDRLNANDMVNVQKLYDSINIKKFSGRFLAAVVRTTMGKGLENWDVKFKAIRDHLRAEGCDVEKLFMGIKY